MIPAKNNIIVKIDHSGEPEYAIMNPVSGSFDLMGQNEYDVLQKLDNGEIPGGELASYLLERGYAYKNREDQDAAIQKAYAEFQDELKATQTQLMFVPTYGCNLACVYCFQQGIDGVPDLVSRETTDAFFEYTGKNFTGGKKPFITLFGGEPLVNSPAQRAVMEYFIQKCVQEGYELSAVTNGYDFTEYLDLLKKVRIKEIQFTLDGSRAVHDSRRATANRKGTFDRVIAGIAAAIENKMPVNLRTVVDMENLPDLMNLAEFLDQKGWLDLPPSLFKTQIGRNYELFECYAKPQHLLTEVELWGRISALGKTYPVLSKFHRPDFKGIRHIVDTGEMYMASFDTCPACKSEWVFDLYGKIYGCTASCGREEYLLGTFWPEVNLNANAIGTWKQRDVKSITECHDCKYDVICGGGCGVVAANKHNGNVLSPDCRPIQGLLDKGVNHYIEDLKAMSGDEPVQKENEPIETCCCNQNEKVKPAEIKKPSCGCSINKMDKSSQQGCAVCGSELVYSKTPQALTCAVCGDKNIAYIYCPEGHYVCDACHSMDILEKAEKLLAASTEKNPVSLARRVFQIPGLKMHGPEYHSLVPAILIAARQNLAGKRDFAQIKEAVSRGRNIKGGSCGLYGNCGAAVGAGIAYSVLEEATSMTGQKRSDANRITGHALLAISANSGARCCKREAVSAIRSFMKDTNYFNDIADEGYICSQFSKNKDCMGAGCPYFPSREIRSSESA